MNRSGAPALPIKRDIGLAYVSSLVVSRCHCRRLGHGARVGL